MLSPSGMPNGLQQARLLAVADTIEANADAFDMGCWECCVAGMAALYATGKRCEDDRSAGIARDFLGLSPEQAHELFAPDCHVLARPEQLPPSCLSKISATWAAATVRHFAMTGRIDWPAAKEALWDRARRQPHIANRSVRVRLYMRAVAPLDYTDAELPVVIETVLEPA